MEHSEVYPTPKGFIDMYGHKGEAVFVQVGDGENQGYYVLPKDEVIEEMHMPNLIVSKASQYMAKRMVPGTSWGTGIGFLEVGTGVGTGSTQNPQVEAMSQVALRVPLIRKAISSWTYLDASGNPTASETNVVQYTTIFTETEAVGALVEQALFGGDATATAGTGYMFNYKAFAVWNKDNTMRLTVVWKLTF